MGTGVNGAETCRIHPGLSGSQMMGVGARVTGKLRLVTQSGNIYLHFFLMPHLDIPFLAMSLLFDPAINCYLHSPPIPTQAFSCDITPHDVPLQPHKYLLLCLR